ncbi:hypothetical protein FACS189421_04240 [Bacteroidia bacterium]|nr:hypothetical protein FACS189421_04240 [Bacteroidia bacterium]
MNNLYNMIDISLNPKTKRSIERSTGIPYSEIEKLDAESIDKLIEKKINKTIQMEYGVRDRRLPARGGVFLALRRYLKLTDIDRKLSKI